MLQIVYNKGTCDVWINVRAINVGNTVHTYKFVKKCKKLSTRINNNYYKVNKVCKKLKIIKF